MLIVGLGNPGEEYEKTRHNIGWWALDILLRQLTNVDLRLYCHSRVYEQTSYTGEKHLFVYPHTFMNNSGKAVKCLYDGKNDMIVIHDDLDLPVGKLRVRHGGSAGGHHGIESIIQSIGTDDFWHIKVGIGRPLLKEEVVDYVLSEPSKKEKEVLVAALEFLASQLKILLNEKNFSLFQQNINSYKFNENN
ncbi:aminoacyl-tRNA hydrolase [Coprothermobacter platensis]|uniref:aminoacyl-tRNA hydrolase n=1 Tax=Coprothermobacter platensis TaxID=108819 RepID=UPI00035D6A8A|nr:aminoacyl-tRNA hydrolase [Coprothermobacter platensis]